MLIVYAKFVNKNNFKSNIIFYTNLQFLNMSLLNPDLVLLIFLPVQHFFVSS